MSTLGLLCIGDTESPHKKTIVSILLSLKEDKHVDLQFTVGEALSCVIAGRYCQSASDPWDYSPGSEEAMEEEKMEVDQSDNVLDSTLKRLLEEFAFSSAPVVRQVQTCTHAYMEVRQIVSSVSLLLFSFVVSMYMDVVCFEKYLQASFHSGKNCLRYYFTRTFVHYSFLF